MCGASYAYLARGLRQNEPDFFPTFSRGLCSELLRDDLHCPAENVFAVDLLVHFLDCKNEAKRVEVGGAAFEDIGPADDHSLAHRLGATAKTGGYLVVDFLRSEERRVGKEWR